MGSNGCRPITDIINGLACPFCGKTALGVSRTITTQTSVIRHRKCRSCGLSHKTEEKAVERAVAAVKFG